MLTLQDNKVNETKKVSIRYDHSSRTYYFFYHRTDIPLSPLILSYDLSQHEWNIETNEYKDLFERQFDCLFYNINMTFEEQVRHLIHYLDIYFSKQLRESKNSNDHTSMYSLSWLRRLRGIRRWASEDMLKEPPAILQRYSAPEKSSSMNTNGEIISVRALAESFYNDDLYRNRTRTYASLFEPTKKQQPIHLSDKPPVILELWLNVTTKSIEFNPLVLSKTNDSPQKIGCLIEETKLKGLAEKFVTYFSGTFQCDIGHQYELEFDGQKWYFNVTKVQFLTKKISDSTKLPKTKIVFLVNDIPHYVRG